MIERARLPNRRFAETFTVQHGKERPETVEVTIGYFPPPNGAVGEVFISSPKVGSGMEAIARDAAVLLSIAIQHHVPLDTMRHAITRNQDGSPATVIGAVLDQLGK